MSGFARRSDGEPGRGEGLDTARIPAAFEQRAADDPESEQAAALAVIHGLAAYRPADDLGKDASGRGVRSGEEAHGALDRLS